MRTNVELQRRYWNEIAEVYQKITRIRLDDFHYGPQIPGERELRLLPELVKGQRALELGCGAAQNSIWLALQGLDCVGVDVSEAQLEHAHKLAGEKGVEVKLVCGAIESFREVVKGEFDLVHSSHALEFVVSPADVLKDAAAVLRPGGTLIFSTDHPLYHGDWIEGVYEDEDNDGEEGESGLFLPSYFSPPDDVRVEEGEVKVVAHAYPVSSWFRWMREAGFEVTEIVEPPAMVAGGRVPYSSDDWAVADGELEAIPGSLIMAGRRMGAAGR